MKRAMNSVFGGLFAVVTLLAAGPACADRYSFGLGVATGDGYLSFGMSNMGGGHHGGQR